MHLRASSLLLVLLLLICVTESFWELLFVRSSPGPVPVALSLTSSEDSYVSSEYPSTNYGSSTTLIVSTSEFLIIAPSGATHHRTFINFDLTVIPPGAEVLEASLKLFVVDTIGIDASYECSGVSGGWSEDSLSWNNQPSLVSGTSVSSIVPKTGNWMIWDVKGSVAQFLSQAKPQFGWCMRDSKEGMVNHRTAFASKESKLNFPVLEISFYPPKLFISGPTSAVAGSWVKLTVERKDQDNNPILKGELRIQLLSDSASGEFCEQERGSAIHEITISNGVSYVSFYYNDDYMGIVTIQADTNQYKDEYYEAGVFRLNLGQDIEGPAVTVTATPNLIETIQPIFISVEVSDPSGVDKLKVYWRWTRLGGPLLDPLLLKDVSYMGQTNPPRLEETIYPNPGLQCHEICVWAEATDMRGNVGEGSDIVIVTVPPPCWTCGCRESDEAKFADENMKVFTSWDSIASGDVVGDERDEVVVAQDDYDDGRLYVYTWNYEKNSLDQYMFGDKPFAHARYTKYDRLTIGDVVGDEKEEIIIAMDDDNSIYIYQIVYGQVKLYKQVNLNTIAETNTLEKGFGEFTHFDALLTANFDIGANLFKSDGKDEIIIARDDDKKLFVLDDFEGAQPIYCVWQAPSEGGFDEFRVTGGTDNEANDDNGHDEIAAGDFIGDSRDEIVYADNRRDRLYIFSYVGASEAASGQAVLWNLQIVRQCHIDFTKYDAICVGDVFGDSRPEILLFRDEDRVVLIYDFFLEPIKMQYIYYSPYDGVTTGNVVGSGKDLIFVAVDEHNSIHVSYSEEFWGTITREE